MKSFRIPLIVHGIALVAAYMLWGTTGLLTVLLLSVLEITFSFDNAVVNSKILGRMNEKWQRIFLSVGIIIAVFGMRLLFPLLIVAITAHISPISALKLAVQNSHIYAEHLLNAHTAIAAFGGTFLVMLFLDWLFEERDIQWLKPLERALYKLGKIDNMSIVLTLILLTVLGITLTQTLLMPGFIGLIAYLIVNSLDTFFNVDTVTEVAKAGIAAFLYLEVLDASFSFDGVIGAFAITSNIFMIALGLGIGAMYIRNLTVQLVRKKTLSEYIYLEHGAHWAIGVLAVLLLASIKFNISDTITGLIGVAFIGVAFIHSLIERKKDVRISQATESVAEPTK